jgi:polar amino acid transport system substrate-binding protein
MRKLLIAATLATVVTVITACSSDTGASRSAGTTNATGGGPAGSSGSGLTASAAVGNLAVDASARGFLPDSTRSSGVLRIGGEADTSPYLQTDGARITGVEADFMVALGKVLSLKVELVNTKFASLVTALASGRVDVAMSDFSDTTEREQQVTFVDYTKSGQIFVVPNGNPKGITALDSLCGHTAGGPTGSLSVQLAQEQSAKCTAGGKKAVTVQTYPDAASAELALQNHRVDVLGIDYGVAVNLAKKSNGQLEVAGSLFGQGLHGAAVVKGNSGLQKALAAAFTTLIADGTYAQILHQWNLPNMALAEVVVNGAAK